MIVREATEADFPAVRELVAAYDDEFWRRPPAPKPEPCILTAMLAMAWSWSG